MKRQVVVHARAKRDIDEALAFYDREAPHLVPAFIDALQTAVESIRETPGASSPRWAHELDWPGLRSLALGEFPWSVFFLEQAKQLAIIRALHHSRDLASLLEAEQ